MQPELDLSKLTLAERLQKQVRPKLGDRPPRMGGAVRYRRRVRVHVGVLRIWGQRSARLAASVRIGGVVMRDREQRRVSLGVRVRLLMVVMAVVVGGRWRHDGVRGALPARSG